MLVKPHKICTQNHAHQNSIPHDMHIHSMKHICSSLSAFSLQIKCILDRYIKPSELVMGRVICKYHRCLDASAKKIDMTSTFAAIYSSLPLLSKFISNCDKYCVMFRYSFNFMLDNYSVIRNSQCYQCLEDKQHVFVRRYRIEIKFYCRDLCIHEVYYCAISRMRILLLLR